LTVRLKQFAAQAFWWARGLIEDHGADAFLA
jgi:hypothetical protein